MFGGAIVDGGQDQSSLLKCKYIFLLGFFFSLVGKNDDEPWHSLLSLLFCFCALREDDNKLVLLVVFLFCFFAPKEDDD